MRGMLMHAYTRIYFSDEARRTRATRCSPRAGGAAQNADRQRDEMAAMPIYRFDIHMQGDDETVFFDV